MRRYSVSEKVLILSIKKGYSIDVNGAVTNPSGNKVKGFINSLGYRSFGIRSKYGTNSIPFNRLQAYLKYGDIVFDSKCVCRHKNGNPLDNSINNILVGSQSMNMMDIPKEIRVKKAKYASSFLKKYNNDEVKLFHKVCKSYKKTMVKFNISSKGTLHYILNT